MKGYDIVSNHFDIHVMKGQQVGEKHHLLSLAKTKI
jgi:hypothetical protein